MYFGIRNNIILNQCLYSYNFSQQYYIALSLLWFIIYIHLKIFFVYSSTGTSVYLYAMQNSVTDTTSSKNFLTDETLLALLRSSGTNPATFLTSEDWYMCNIYKILSI